MSLMPRNLVLHLWEMTKFSIENGFGNTPPLTLGSLAVTHLENIWQEEDINSRDVLGQEVVTQRTWNRSTGRYNTRRRTVPISFMALTSLQFYFSSIIGPETGSVTPSFGDISCRQSLNRSKLDIIPDRAFISASSLSNIAFQTKVRSPVLTVCE